MDFSSICRLCLSDENLIPIFTNISDYIQMSETIFLTTGVKVNNLSIVKSVLVIFMVIHNVLYT